MKLISFLSLSSRCMLRGHSLFYFLIIKDIVIELSLRKISVKMRPKEQKFNRHPAIDVSVLMFIFSSNLYYSCSPIILICIYAICIYC